ncbi:MAG: Trm112 family protein [Mailhella sp.]|nr:Trm112 family protein [Mailhella sp.]
MPDTQLDILLCPRCRQNLLTVLDPQTGVICPRCRLIYPVLDDVPILAEDAAIAAGAWLMGIRGSTPEPSPNAGEKR